MWPLQSPILLIYLSGVYGLKLQIEEFYSKSFVPKDIHLAYHIVRNEEINFNLTVEVPFPGKLLMHIFVRKLSNQFGGPDQVDLVRFRNLDLCKLLDSMRNMTMQEVQGESLLPSTFIISCPFVPGFYYVKDSTLDVKLVPIRIPEGRYMMLLELIQVYEEVMKLVTTRIKFVMRRPPGYKDPSSDFDSSDEDEAKEKKEPNNEEEGEKKEPNNEEEGEKREPNNEEEQEKTDASSEVTYPSNDNFEEAEEGINEPSSEVTASSDNNETSTDYD